MPEPPLSLNLTVWGARLRERTEPLAPDDDAYDWTHAILCEALSKGFGRVGEIVDPPDPIPPMAPLLDPDLAPDWALPFVAQFAGVVLPSSLTGNVARDYIKALVSHTRGSRQAITAAARLHLTGGKTVWFRERDGSAYQLEVVTRTAETPDPDLVESYVRAAKPGGIVLRYRVVDGLDYQQLTTESFDLSEDYAEMATHYADYTALQEGDRT